MDGSHYERGGTGLAEVVVFVLLIVAIGMLGITVRGINKDLEQLQTLTFAIGCKVARELGDGGIVKEGNVEFGIIEDGE